jgi:putative transposase
MAAENLSVQAACRVPSASESGYYEHLNRAQSERSIRHSMLTDLISQIHLESQPIYGTRLGHAELTPGRGLVVGHNQVEPIMRRAGLQGLAGRPKWKGVRAYDIASDLVKRDFTRVGPKLWSSSSPNSPREGNVYY